MELRTASRTRSKLRIGLFGASGSGKTYSALLLARGLASDWDKIALIDTERGSGDLYRQLGPYKTLTLESPYEPERYINAIGICEQSGVEVIIIDSISHEWAGKGGCLEIVDKVQSRNDYGKWKDVTPRHNAFVERILQSGTHMICCGRSKDDVDMVKNERGKLEPQKVGLKAVTRDGFDYEMTVCFDIDKWHQALCSKDRTQLFDGKPAFKIDETTGQQLSDWMNMAPEAPKVEPPPVYQPKPKPEPDTEDPREALRNAINQERAAKGLSWPKLFELFGKLTNDSTTEELQTCLSQLINYSAPPSEE